MIEPPDAIEFHASVPISAVFWYFARRLPLYPSEVENDDLFTSLMNRDVPAWFKERLTKAAGFGILDTARHYVFDAIFYVMLIDGAGRRLSELNDNAALQGKAALCLARLRGLLWPVASCEPDAGARWLDARLLVETLKAVADSSHAELVQTAAEIDAWLLLRQEPRPASPVDGLPQMTSATGGPVLPHETRGRSPDSDLLKSVKEQIQRHPGEMTSKALAHAVGVKPNTFSSNYSPALRDAGFTPPASGHQWLPPPDSSPKTG